MIFSDECGQNLNLVKPTQYDGGSHVKSGYYFRFSKWSTYWVLAIFSFCYQSWISVYTFEFQNGHVMTSPANKLQESSLVLLLIGWWRHNTTILNNKKYTEIQEWHFEKLILKICGHFGKTKRYPDLTWLLLSYCAGLTQFKFWSDSSLNITLRSSHQQGYGEINVLRSWSMDFEWLYKGFYC